jgi:hypothetical protein
VALVASRRRRLLELRSSEVEPLPEQHRWAICKGTGVSMDGEPSAVDRGDLALFLVRCLAALGLVVAAVWLPWATFKASQLGITLDVTPGGLSVALCALGLAVVGISMVQLVRPARILGWLLLALSALALVLAIVAALRSISTANHLSMSSTQSAIETSYATGSTLAATAGFVMVAASALALQRASARAALEQRGQN